MDINKAADQATNALSTMLMIVGQQEPDSPIADALKQMMMAVGEIAQRFGGAADGAAAGMPEAGAPAPPQAAMSGNPGMAQAATEAAAMMNPNKPPMGA